MFVAAACVPKWPEPEPERPSKKRREEEDSSKKKEVVKTRKILLCDETILSPREEDAINKTEPSSVTEGDYDDVVWKHLREQEVARLKNETGQPCASVKNARKIVLEWLQILSEHLDLKDTTFFLSVNYFDRYTSRMVVERPKIQLVAVACLLISTKYEEVSPPNISALIRLCNYTYTKDHILEMEAKVLSCLDYQLTVPTIYVFLSKFLTAWNTDEEKVLAIMLAKQSVFDYGLGRKYLPSLLAAACMYLTFLVSRKNIWTSELEIMTGFQVADTQFQTCKNELWEGVRQGPINSALSQRLSFAPPIPDR